ncbi:MAG: thiol-disulfide oxidoreductase DCC family protein [Marinifilaceae bacterium]
MLKDAANKKITPPIVLFDGVCNFCEKSVQFILRRERSTTIRFAALQSARGQELLKAHNMQSNGLKSLVFIENGQAYILSTAALRICNYLKFPWNLCSSFLLLPSSFRDSMYNFIANNRYKWFGRKEQCMVPREEWKNRFLE